MFISCTQVGNSIHCSDESNDHASGMSSLIFDVLTITSFVLNNIKLVLCSLMSNPAEASCMDRKITTIFYVPVMLNYIAVGLLIIM